MPKSKEQKRLDAWDRREKRLAVYTTMVEAPGTRHRAYYQLKVKSDGPQMSMLEVA